MQAPPSRLSKLRNKIIQLQKKFENSDIDFMNGNKQQTNIVHCYLKKKISMNRFIIFPYFLNKCSIYRIIR
jgi:hypothetical protein